MSLPQMKDKTVRYSVKKQLKSALIIFLRCIALKILKRLLLKPVTSVFLHENFLHLAANMFFLMSLPKTSLLSFTGKAFLKLFSLAYLSSSLAYFLRTLSCFSGLSGVLAADCSVLKRCLKVFFFPRFFQEFLRFLTFQDLYLDFL